MPPRKKITEEAKAEEDPSLKNASTPDPDIPNDSGIQSEPSNAESKGEDDNGQLFFSTDGTEPKKEEDNPYLEKEPAGNVPQTEEQNKDDVRTNPNQDKPGVEQKRHNHPNNNPNRGPKKQNWQDKKKQRNKPRQKFKKPRRLPYEETEARPLELGELLESEAFKTEEGLSTLAEEFVNSEQAPVLLDELLALNLQELKENIASHELNLGPAPLREEIFDALFAKCLEIKIPVLVSGILQVMEDGHGFLLQQKDDYRLKSQCPIIPDLLIKKFGLKTGQSVKGYIRAKMEGSTCPVFLQVDQVMEGDPEEATRVTPFTELIPYYPLERIYLETDEKVEWDNVSMRVVDLVSPVGFGQRGLIVAPPRTGKTVLQQGIARALRVNNPKAHLIVLLVDERPEEVTDFRRQVPDAEVIASTFDESAESHVHAAEIVIEKARRMVEHNKDVVILLDSITRLARAYNTTMPNSGKILSGGVEATALQRPKRFFGSARNIEGGGSLTILGTALVETGSKMDEVIFEEFKGTGNMELHLDRELSNKRIFPALDFEKSGTRKEELLYHPDELNKIYALRRSLKGVPPAEAMEMFIQRVRKTKNNPEFLMGLGR
ncbi:MAG: transcription termination factor Rho [Verrucomicrobia bacterium TMED56]|jgi:transcription termination factor Rho|nr:MAG: transcription termination factor Rho [Verrucomicrobia bacterium TMED56]